MPSMVGRTSFISWRCAPSIVSPIGTPCPSVSTLRLTPLLPRSVGLGPVFSPPKGALVIAPSIESHCQSIPQVPSKCSCHACHHLRETPACTHYCKRS